MGELRKDPILGRWVIIATERSKRPGAFHPKNIEGTQTDLEKCPFCAGHEKMTPPEIYSVRHNSSKPNTPGWEVRVVPNKFPALGIDTEIIRRGEGMYDMMSNFGAHEVVIETPNHTREAADQTEEEISNWLRTLQFRIEDLSRDHRFKYILIFKNKGPNAGASLSHPHHQIIATPVNPKRVKEELKGTLDYYNLKERCILCDVIHQELKEQERIVYENDEYISFCPYASRFPYETWIMPKKHTIDFYAKPVKDSIPSLANHMKTVLRKLKVLLNDPEYNYIVHSAPNRYSRSDYWQTIKHDFHWHIELFPRVTEIAGFEWGSGFYINPVQPEQAAKDLREIQI